jgi:hypothetical protein
MFYDMSFTKYVSLICRDSVASLASRPSVESDDVSVVLRRESCLLLCFTSCKRSMADTFLLAELSVLWQIL